MDDDDWKNAINKLETNESKLLYLIYYIYKKNSITEQNKKQLKTLVLKEDRSLNNYIKELVESKNLSKFIENSKLLVANANNDLANDHSKSAVHKALLSRLNEFDNNPKEDNDLEEITSPQGTNLMLKKKMKQRKKKDQ